MVTSVLLDSLKWSVSTRFRIACFETRDGAGEDECNVLLFFTNGRSSPAGRQHKIGRKGGGLGEETGSK